MPISLHSDGTCEHVESVSGEAKVALMKRFRKVMNWAEGEDMRQDMLLKTGAFTAFPHCSLCMRGIARPSACLTCELVTCRVASTASHATSTKRRRLLPARTKDCMKEHYRDNEEHFLAIDTVTGTVYCHKCEDWVYAPLFETAAGRAKRLQEERLDWSINLMGVLREKYKPNHNPEKIVMPEGMSHYRCNAVRPLINLSQTCFLSAILQALLHNPLWKQYYLSDSHDRRSCALRRARAIQSGEVKPSSTMELSQDGQLTAIGAEENGPGGMGGIRLGELGLSVGECMSCEMDGAFAEAYGGDNVPFSPVTMLFSMWKASSELAAYAQQDAHTFFLTALNQVHAHSTERIDGEGCGCIAHRTFAGTLLSTVTCSRCGTSTRTQDPILDVSLELKGTPVPAGPSSGSRVPGVGWGTAAGVAGGAGVLTLAECFRRYTAKEPLSGKVYACGQCQNTAGHADATKQLSFDVLPATLAIQLKRFEHNNAGSLKVDTMVNFPTELDMRPYMTDSLQGNPADLPSELYRYRLTTVVTHEGKLDNGHYWADVESGCEWFHLDDDKVTLTTLGQVLSQKAYMLFYVKTSLPYDKLGA